MSNSSNPLVTVAIPTYNRADSFLANAIECAIGQTYRNTEILISDNCSTDHTEDIVAGFSDQRIKYVKQKHNIGANNNFNYCISQARGDYFYLFLDDDVADNDFIETCVSAAGGDSPGIIRTGTRIIDTDGNALTERPNRAAGLSMTDFMLAWFSNKTTLYVCSTLFNTKGLKEIGGFRSRHNLFQDVMAEVQLAAKYGRVDIYNIKAGFRKHETNMGAGAKVLDWCEDSRDLLNIICKLLPEDETLLRTEGTRFFCRMNYAYALNINSPVERYLTYLKVARFFDYSYSPLGFVYDKEVLPKMRAMKRKFLDRRPTGH